MGVKIDSEHYDNDNDDSDADVIIIRGDDGAECNEVLIMRDCGSDEADDG